MLFYNDVCSEILSRWLIDEIACFFEPECHFRAIKLAEDFHIIVAILKVKASVLNALLTVRLYFWWRVTRSTSYLSRINNVFHFIFTLRAHHTFDAKFKRNLHAS